MARKKDGTMEHDSQKSEEFVATQRIFEDFVAKHDLGCEISFYSILQERFQVWVKEQTEQAEGSGGTISGDVWSESEKDFIDNCRKKFQTRLEKILYEGVVDILKSPRRGIIMIPEDAKESALFLVDLGDAGKEYRKELVQLTKGKEIPSKALCDISEKIQRIFSHKEGMALEIQRHINTRGLSQTKEMCRKLGEFYDILTMALAITDTDAYQEISKAMDTCNETMMRVLKEWCYQEKELPDYDSWIREKLKLNVPKLGCWKIEAAPKIPNDI